MHYVYIIRSINTGRYYVGESADPSRRLVEHKQGKTNFGRRNASLKIAFTHQCRDRSEAKYIESFIKRQKSRNYIEKIIKGLYAIPAQKT